MHCFSMVLDHTSNVRVALLYPFAIKIMKNKSPPTGMLLIKLVNMAIVNKVQITFLLVEWCIHTNYIFRVRLIMFVYILNYKWQIFEN